MIELGAEVIVTTGEHIGVTGWYLGANNTHQLLAIDNDRNRAVLGSLSSGEARTLIKTVSDAGVRYLLLDYIRVEKTDSIYTGSGFNEHLDSLMRSLESLTSRKILCEERLDAALEFKAKYLESEIASEVE